MKRFLYILVLTGLLAACSQGTQPTLEMLSDPPLPDILVKLKPLALPQDKLYNPVRAENANCSVNEFSMPPQGYKVMGSEGGLSYAPLTRTSRFPSSIGAGLRSSFLGNAAPLLSSLIIIADDFRGGVYGLSTEVFTQNTLDMTTLKKLQAQGKLSHGALVFRHTQDVILGTGLYTVDSVNSTANKKVYTAIGSRAKLTILAVDTGLKDTTTISTAIRNALIANSARSKVVNMSFGLMPCAVNNDYNLWEPQIAGLQTFEDYMQELARVNEVDKDQMVKAIIDNTDISTDPLKQLINDLTYGASKHTYVGAAGNYSLKYSMYPANWSNVINVTGSSSDNPSIRDARFFNQGEVMHIGASLRLSPPIPGAKTLYYIGTSFATPTVSAYTALDATRVQRCWEFTTNPISELAKDILLVDKPLEGVQGAVQVRCGSF